MGHEPGEHTVPWRNQETFPALGVFSASFSILMASSSNKSIYGLVSATGTLNFVARFRGGEHTKVSPIILRFFSGSVTPLRRSRKSLVPSITVRLIPRCSFSVTFTFSDSLRRINPATCECRSDSCERFRSYRCQCARHESGHLNLC